MNAGIGSNVRNALTGIGGGIQVGVGVGLCSTGLGCVVGAPLIAVGVANVGESVTGFTNPTGEGFNLLQGALQSGMSANQATAANGVINLGLDLVTLNMPNLAAKIPQMTIKHSGRFDYMIRATRAKDILTPYGIGLQAGTTTFTTFGTLSGMKD